MDCNDDIAGDLSTEETAELGVPFSSNLMQGDETCRDVDYFAVHLDYGKLYEVFDSGSSADFRSGELVRLRDKYNFTKGGAGNYFIPDYPKRLGIYRANYSGLHYVRVTSRYGAPADYNLTVRPISHVQTRPTDLDLGFAAIDSLTDEVDKIVFRIETVVGRTYLANVFGADSGLGTLEDPWLGIGDQTDQYYNDNGGAGREPLIRFTAKKTFAHVHVGGTGTGEFRVNVRQLDEIPLGTGTRNRIEPGTGVSEFIETSNDIDWFRVPMQEGSWYRVTTVMREQELTAIVRAPDLSIESVIRPVNQTVQVNDYGGVYGVAIHNHHAKTTGDHFLIARARRPERLGTYEFFVESTAAPLGEGFQSEEHREVGLRRFKVTNDEVIQVRDLIDIGEYSPTEYQVIAGEGLYRDDVAQDSGGIIDVPSDELGLWTHQMVAHDKTVDVWVRAKIEGVWSRWDRTPIYHQIDNPDLLSGSKWTLDEANPFVGVEFAESLPSWFDGIYTGFAPAANLGSFDALVSIERQADRLARRSLDGQIKIFKASNVEGYVDAYAPGPGQGGDIVLNSSIYTEDFTVQQGTREYLELLKGFAIALGLKEASSSSLRYSIMSDEEPTEGNFPYTFLAQDVLALDSLYGRTIRPGRTRESPELAEPNGYGLSPAIKRGPYVDLRQGGEVIYDGDFDAYGFTETTGFTGGPSRNGGTLRGSHEVDGGMKVFGNSLENELTGNVGWMNGRGGNDTLAGGFGANWYGYEVGHGDDIIEENRFDNETVGNDVVRIIGNEAINLSLDNLQFTRPSWTRRQSGDDVYLEEAVSPATDLRIDVLNEQGNSEGSISIHDQGLVLNRVETLEIYNGAAPQGRINLLNLFDQLKPDEPTQFRLSGGGNGLGSFVNPS